MQTETDIAASENKQVERLMGNTFEFTVVGDSKDKATEKITLAIAEIRRIENQINYLGCIIVDDNNNIYSTKNIRIK